MAPSTLTSNSFHFTTTTPHSWPTPKNQKLTVIAQAGKQSPFSSFRVGKKKPDDNESDSQVEESNNPWNKFSFNLNGKISDVRSLIPLEVAKPSLGPQRRKDAGTVFVAGATGQAGIRIVQSLLQQGFTVRAGVHDLGAAQDLARFASDYKIIPSEKLKRLNALEASFESVEIIGKAIGNASKAVVTIGSAEYGLTAPVTTTDAFKVVEASNLAGVDHVVIIYDSKSNSSPSTYNTVVDGISSFLGNLFAAKSQPLSIAEFLQKVAEETDVSYTLLKTNLTEDFSEESSYNVVVSAEGSSSANDFKVSKSQIASLVADVFSNTAAAELRVVEVSTNPSAPSKPVDQLFSAIPKDGRRKAYQDSLAKIKAEEEAIKASEKAREAAEAANKLEKEVKKLSEQKDMASNLAKEAQMKAEAAGTSVENLMNRAKDISSGFSWKEISSKVATAVQRPEEEPKVQVATVRGEAKARNLPPVKAVTKKVASRPPPKSKPEPREAKKEVRNVFGGLFKQETIYIDDD